MNQREIKVKFWDGKQMLDMTYVDSCIGLQDALLGKTDLIPLQFTGLKDSKGVEIYEGDILECKKLKQLDEIVSFKGVVIWKDAGFYIQESEKHFNELFYCLEAKSLEVIGNICETKK